MNYLLYVVYANQIMYIQSAESYDNYAQYGYNSKIDGGAKNYYGAARRSGISGQWLYRYFLPSYCLRHQCRLV